MKNKLLQIAICAQLTVMSLCAVDQTLTLNTPPRLVPEAAIPGAFTPNMDMANLQAVLTAVLGVAPADKTYYILHTVQYNAGSSTVASTHWFVYYSDWAKPMAWQSLWDPDFRNHFKKARLYGTSKIVLAYVQGPILGKLIDGTTIRAEVGASWLTAMHARIVAEQNATFPREGDDAASYGIAASQKAKSIVSDIKFLKAGPPPSYPLDSRVALIAKATTTPAVTKAYIEVLQDATEALTAAKQAVDADVPGARFGFLRHERTEAEKTNPSTLESAIAAYLTAFAVAQTDAKLNVLQTGVGTLPSDLVDTDGTLLSCGTTLVGRFCGRGTDASKLLSIAYRIEVTKKEPSPLTNFKLVLGMITGQSAATTQLVLPTTHLLAVNSSAFDIHYLPSDVLVKALLDPDSDKPVEVASQKFDNEGRYRYDFSFAVPVKSLDKLQYSTTDGRVESKSVQKQNIYAVANFYPIPIDTKTSQFRFVPGIMAGLAITGHPLDQQLYAGSIGLWKLEAFVGAVVSRQLRPSTAPSAKNGLAPDWGAHLTFGVNVPARTISDLFSKKK